jgi:hypothetical protein
MQQQKVEAKKKLIFYDENFYKSKRNRAEVKEATKKALTWLTHLVHNSHAKL